MFQGAPMKTILPLLMLVLAVVVAAPAAAATAKPAPAAAAAEPHPIVLARMQDAARSGRFAEAYKRGLRNAPPGAVRDRVLALDDDLVADVFARILARRFDVAEATAIAAFYASADGQALTAAQLSPPEAPAPKVDPAQRKRIEAFFAADPGRRFNAVLAEKATVDELQLALAFIAGPGK
jgi:hypothetical protein